ncbi:MAG: MORN repeat protein [Lactococcus sp.]
MAQTFKEKLAELEAKRRFEQEVALTDSSDLADAPEILETSELSEQSVAQSDVAAVLPAQTITKLKFKKLTLAILVSLFVIVIAQLYALGDFSVTRQVTQKTLDQKLTYQGGLNNGRFSGPATITDSSGNTLKAQFQSGKLVGPMTYTKNNAYVVTEKADKVTITLADKSVVHQAAGQYTFNGTIFTYEGAWRFAGLWQGKMHFANGASYEGAWKNGLPDGQGTYTPIVGEAITGVFKMGELEK